MLFFHRTREKRHGILLDRPLDDPRRCRDCDGACCRAFPSVPLAWEEFLALQALGARRLESSLTGEYRLLIENGCEFLAGGRCAIYPYRPEVCRRFYCEDLAPS
ncbi:MAG: YkgJ family cysteine cluster protein [Deltaproteobacteria bacterium]|nr:MAG: YkgJ family cysteine cluster protein [Deltaproteobacteria bacterium]